MTDNIQDIREKVKALLRKASDAAASPSEAEGAMRLAQKLMAKYSLSEAELNAVKEEDFCEATWQGRYHKGAYVIHPVDRYCSVIVGKFCGVVPFLRNNGSTVALFGLDADVELAKWMLHAFREQFEHDWEVFKRFQMESKRLLDIKDARKSFAHGFTEAINNRLKDWMFRQSPEGGSGEGALVLRKHDIVAAELERRGIHLAPTGRRGSRGSHDQAAGAGYNAGNAANVGRATAGAGRVLIGR